MKVFTISHKSKVLAYTEPVSMSYGFGKLPEIVKAKLGQEPNSGNLYVFRNKKSNYIKILYWGHNGWNMLAKKLPKGHFDVPTGTMTVAIMEKMINEVVVHGAKKIRRLKTAA